MNLECFLCDVQLFNDYQDLSSTELILAFRSSFPKIFAQFAQKGLTTLSFSKLYLSQTYDYHFFYLFGDYGNLDFYLVLLLFESVVFVFVYLL